VSKEKNIVVGCDIGGAHLKIARAEDGRIVEALTLATPIWLGLDRLTDAARQAAPLFEGSRLNVFTMTGELSDIFPSRESGIASLLGIIAEHFPGKALIYAGRASFVAPDRAIGLAADIASANWHASAALVAKQLGTALFVDMGSTTTDIIVTRNGAIENDGYNDAGRLATGELVYTGYTRSALIGIANSAPVRGAMSPLMNEYFASMADVHRILGVLDENDDKQPAADGQAKTVEASILRMARMVGRDASDLTMPEWRDIARWFSERQLRTVHDAAFRVGAKLAGDPDAPIVGAGIGRWQIRRLADRMERRFIDFADLIAASDEARSEASSAAPAAALALLAQDLD
jgi:(4-(4-[2-(gamma-L-glutamylamino)ethyl]phenoxymethyl)furan-2-yl)methanamine synthase